METPAVSVQVSKELLEQLGEWSPPVEVKIIKLDSGEYEMVARTHTCEERA
jgi:hypothetical protein